MQAWGDESGVVRFPDGRSVRGARAAARGAAAPPDFTVYLLGRDPGEPPWASRWVRWPDFRTPASTPDAVAVLAEAWERAARERVEVACGGGVGSTGTALALLASCRATPTCPTWIVLQWDTPSRGRSSDRPVPDAAAPRLG